MNHQKRRSTLTTVILEHVKNHIKEYGIVIILFLIGIILGVIFINNANETQQNQISGYITNFVNSLKDNYQIDQGELLKTSIIDHIGLALIFWFLGSTVVGIPILYFLIGYRGFCLGYTAASAVATLGTGKGTLFLVASTLFQNILLIPCILALGVSGIRLYHSIMKDKRRENIKTEILRHTIFCLIMLVVMILSSFIEVYVSSNLFSFVVRYF